MHVQVLPHPMTGSMQVVQSLAPHILSGENIHLRAGSAAREDAPRELNVSAQHQRVDVSLLVANGSEGDGSRDIGGTVEELRTAVEQQQPLGKHGDISLGCRLVVDDGTVRLVAADGVERDVAEPLLLGTQGRELPVEGHLRLPTRLNGRLQPLQELHHRHAVLDHRPPEALNLSSVLDGLHPGDGRLAAHHLALHGLHQRVAGFVGVEQDVVFEVVVQTARHVLIVVDVHPAVVQIGLYLGRQLYLIYI